MRMNANENYYTIAHLCLITGFLDRTIRSYISSGILRGYSEDVLEAVNRYYVRNIVLDK